MALRRSPKASAYFRVDANISIPATGRERPMRHSSRYDDYIAGRDFNLDATFAFLTIYWFGSTKDKT
jgi:hypothetical protein